MSKIAKIIRKINYIGFIMSAGLIFLMSLIVAYGVVMRAFFNSPPIWVNEIGGYLLVITAFLAAGYTLNQGGHIRIDSLDSKLPPILNNIFFIINHLAVLSFSLALMWYGFLMVHGSYSLNWKASTMLGTPLYIPQSFIPLGGLLLTLQVIGLMIERWINDEVN